MRCLPTQLVFTLKYLAIILLGVLALTTAAGQNLTGHWAGGLPQDDKTFVFTMHVELKQVGNQLSGTSQLTDNTGAWVVEQFSGTLTGTQVSLTESGILACTPGTERNYWCVKKLLGTLTTAKNTLTIAGHWSAAAPCAPGQFTISKAVPPATATATVRPRFRPKRRPSPPLAAPSKKVVINQKTTFQNVVFAQSKAVLLPASQLELNQLVAVLAARPALRVSIDGHADKIGEAAKNLTLSQQRAQAVKQYLVAHGIEETRIDTHGYGDTRLVCPAPCAANQRVEFTLAQ